jgi:methylated-DNA-protein-cysteine methyltransferase-like protein
MTRRKTTFNELFRPTQPAVESNPAIEAIWQAVYAIPRGRVSTYGAVARAAGFPGRARLTGFALREAPKSLQLPWHRVIGARGRIVFPPASSEHMEQARRLRAEDVTVKAGRVENFGMIRLEEVD